MSATPKPGPPASQATPGESREVRRKAATGALLVGARSLAVRLLGLAGSVVLARLLTPADFGVVAVGSVVMAAGSTLTDGGLGAALIRGPRPPSREELGAVTGFQLAGTLVVVALTGAISAVIGGHALITAVMVCSLPILTLQTPGAITLERDLNYRPVVVVEIVQTLAYNVWAIATVVALGAGVWGLASGVVVAALAGTIAMTMLAPVGFVLPRLGIARIRPLLGFGVRFQAIDAVGLARDQGLNSLTGAIGGLGTLGLWSLTYRILQPGTFIFEALRRVSYPGMARLRELGEDSSALVARALTMTCVAGSLVLAPLAACPRALVPALFGQRWGACADTVSMAAWAMLLSGTLSVAASGYLLAEGHASDALGIVLGHTIVGLLVAAALLPVVGITALGYCSLATAATDVVLFSRALRRRVHGLHPIRALLAPTAVSSLGTATGLLITVSSGHDLLAAASGALVALVVVLAGHWLTDRDTLATLFATASRATRSAAARA